MPKNPVRQVFKKQQPFVIFHTHVIDRQVLDAAVAARKSLEVDLSINENGEIYVGHPPSFYTAQNLTLNNLPLDTILSEMKVAGLFLVLDCKNVRVLPKAKEIIEAYGAENCLYHSWSDGLTLNPFLELQQESEPNWAEEELPHTEILKLREATGVPMTLSCHRGLTYERFETDGDAIVDRISEILDDSAEGVSFVLPDNQAAPMPAMKRLIDRGILPHVHIDHVLPEARPPIYLGWTDSLELASDPQDFQ